MRCFALVWVIFVVLPPVVSIAQEGGKSKAPDRPGTTAAPAAEKAPAEAGRLPVYEALLKSTIFIEGKCESGISVVGTGWLLDLDKRLAVTNEHVAAGLGKEVVKSLRGWLPVVREGEAIHELEYYLQHAPPSPIKVIYTDAVRDLALIQLDSLPAGAAAIPLSDRGASVGQQLHSLAGFPKGSQGLFIYSQGATRATYDRRIAAGSKIKVLETQMPLNQGNSGGPIVNDDGKLVGVFEGLMVEPGVQLVNMCIDLTEVRAFLEEALPLAEPQTADVFNKRGDLHYEADRLELAMADYNAALKIDPKNAEATCNRGWVFYQQDDADTAMDLFNAALKLDERLATAFWGRATIYRDREKYQESVDDLTRAIGLAKDDKDMAGLYNERGMTRAGEGSYEAALADYNRAAEKNPEMAWAFANQGEMLTKLKRYDEALTAIEKANKIDGKEPEFWNLAGNAWYARERYDAAAAMYSRAIDMNQENAQFYCNRGGAYRLLGKYETAMADLLKAVALAPEEDEYHNELGLVLYAAGRYDLALPYFSKAHELDASQLIYIQNRGDTHQKLGKHQEAVADLGKAIAIEDTAELRAMRGRSYLALSQTALAKADFEAAEKADASYKTYDRVYLKVANDTSEQIKVHLQYFTRATDGTWNWYPGAPETKKILTFTIDPGTAPYLFDESYKITGSQVRIWAEGVKSGLSWSPYRDVSYVLVYEPGYISNTGEYDTVTIPIGAKK